MEEEDGRGRRSSTMTVTFDDVEDVTMHEEPEVGPDVKMMEDEAMQTYQRTDQWLYAMKRKSYTYSNEHVEQILDDEHRTQEAARQRDWFQEQHQQLQSEINGLESTIRAKERDLEMMEAEKAQREPRLHDLREEADEEEAKLEELQQASQDFRKKHQEQLSTLRKGVEMYHRTGLFFERTEGQSLRVVFTQIDENEPEREFSFHLSVHDASDKYHVTQCNPEVAVAEKLAEDLNETGDFTYFIKSMRTVFQSQVMMPPPEVPF